ncbi:Crp/Fnr family transcriptional regulator [Methylosinus sp. PW1]|uniref:Crp/Fnr family transcriptional regulator n=1 Tax=Methylosinus sp. PW1 TaxID=107636 RepID=UPI00055DDB79|nr:cyclic nucleotide-binding domain-containing protein [Methylosinus sp. PW1]
MTSDHILYLVIAAAWMQTVAAVASAYSKTMIRLRIASTIANFLGVIVGATSGNMAVLARHLILFPLDLMRLREMRKLVASVKRAADGELKVEWLKPFMHPSKVKADALLFRKGEDADRAYMLIEGEIELPEVGIRLPPGTLFGEMALFTEDGVRTASARALTDCRLLSITYEEFEQLYFQNPQFGLYLIRLIVRRCQANTQQLEAVAWRRPTEDIGA